VTLFLVTSYKSATLNNVSLFHVALPKLAWLIRNTCSLFDQYHDTYRSETAGPPLLPSLYPHTEYCYNRAYQSRGRWNTVHALFFAGASPPHDTRYRLSHVSPYTGGRLLSKTLTPTVPNLIGQPVLRHCTQSIFPFLSHTTEL
jgi:hypothetical protein